MIEFYRLNQSTTEAENLIVGLHRDDLATVNVSVFILHRINSEEVNKLTES